MEPHIHTLCEIVKKTIPEENVKTIFDVGARDLEESIFFASKYPNSIVHSFECNPATIPLCIEKQKTIPNIHLHTKAINNYNGNCKFYPTNPSKTITTWNDGNPGASSLFKANNTYPNEHYVQDEIDVQCMRLDSVIVSNTLPRVDILWMDLQGAELLALESLGVFLKDVLFICTEVEMSPIYENQCLFRDVDAFLERDFERVHGNLNTQWTTDIIYKNKKLI